jgi:glycolate oxidase
VTTDDFERTLYSQEIANLPPEVVWVFHVKPDVVVRPATTEHVAAVMKVAALHGVPVTPRGAASLGLGGAIPSRGGIVLDLASMNAIEAVDPATMSATVQAGVTWEDLRSAAHMRGMRLGAYPSSATAATVGGWISTGGVGIGSYKYGTAADQLRWLEVVLPDGRVLDTGFPGVSSNASGYTLAHLFCGAEGTLGVVTRACLRLQPRAGDVVPTAYSFKDMGTAARAVLGLTRAPVTPYHISFVDSNHLRHMERLGQEVPAAAGAVVSVALEGHPDVVAVEDREVAAAMGREGGSRLSDAEAAKAWEERAYEFRVKRLGPGLVPGSVFVPAARFEAAVADVYTAIEELGMAAGITGIVSDRNTVDLMPYYIVDDRKLVKNLAVMGFMKRLTDISIAHGGRPVGVGMWFAQNLDRVHGEGAEVMRALKRALDPRNLMNPGKVVEVGTGLGFAVPGTVMQLGLEMLGVVKRTLPPDTEPGELGGPGGTGWRELKAKGDEVAWLDGRERGAGRREGGREGAGEEKGEGKAGGDGGAGDGGGRDGGS